MFVPLATCVALARNRRAVRSCTPGAARAAPAGGMRSRGIRGLGTDGWVSNDPSLRPELGGAIHPKRSRAHRARFSPSTKRTRLAPTLRDSERSHGGSSNVGVRTGDLESNSGVCERAGRPAFGDYFTAGVCFGSDSASGVSSAASRLAASRLPMRLIATHASALLLRGRALPCSQL